MKNGETPAKKRKFDVFNFFYSIGAVVILIGVIAKFLEWKLQDPLLLTGLGVEALVFTMSAIQYKDDKVEKRKVKAENYTSWTHNLLILDQTSLEEIFVFFVILTYHFP
jgi:hypothetical protein